MKATTIITLLAFAMSASATAADHATPGPADDKQRIELLVKQNQLLIEENSKLRELVDRPKSNEEVFADCMQATKGQGAMAANSIGGHCSQILKK